jgi:cytidine deaminase
MDYDKLVKEAFNSMEHSYSPYSKFRVGAALMSEDGSIYSGANIENSSFGATICAERTAIVKAAYKGVRVVKAIAIASDSEDYIYPCGICRQVMTEFGDDNMLIICSRKDGQYKVHKLGELLPHAFRG